MRATYFAVLMILYTVANIMSIWMGISELTQLNKLTGLISLVVLSVYYIFTFFLILATRININNQDNK